MMEPVTIKSRALYLISNVIGLLMVLGLAGWFVYLSYDDGKIQLQSVLFWIAVLILTMIPKLVRQILSAKKSVSVTEGGIHIYYLFKQETPFVNLAEVKEFKSSSTSRETVIRPASISASFTMVMKDGRSFNFDRSEFTDYGKLKAVVIHVWKNRT